MSTTRVSPCRVKVAAALVISTLLPPEKLISAGWLELTLSPANIVVPVGATALPTVTLPCVTTVPRGDPATVSATVYGAVTGKSAKQRINEVNFACTDLRDIPNPLYHRTSKTFCKPR